MARGDLVVFNEALAFMIDGGWESADVIKCALITSAVAPTQTTATPSLGDFTEVTAGGNYTAGGVSLGDLGTCVTQSGAVMTFDSTTNPSWAQHASNPTNAAYAIIYNDTSTNNDAIAYVDLAGPVDMTAGDLTITWNGSGIYTITNS